jgi:antitoxin HicB
MKFNTGIMMIRFVYPALLTADQKDGGFVVTFRDLPEAITQGDSLEQALNEAADCLEESIAMRIDDKLEIPQPSQLKHGEYLVAVPAQTALKAALNLAMREKGMSKVELANTLNIHEKEVRRILDPHHVTKLSTMERTLVVLGQRIELITSQCKFTSA